MEVFLYTTHLHTKCHLKTESVLVSPLKTSGSIGITCLNIPNLCILPTDYVCMFLVVYTVSGNFSTKPINVCSGNVISFLRYELNFYILFKGAHTSKKLSVYNMTYMLGVVVPSSSCLLHSTKQPPSTKTMCSKCRKRSISTPTSFSIIPLFNPRGTFHSFFQSFQAHSGIRESVLASFHIFTIHY